MERVASLVLVRRKLEKKVCTVSALARFPIAEYKTYFVYDTRGVTPRTPPPLYKIECEE